MKNNRLLILLASVMVVLASSCTTYQKAVPMTSVSAQIIIDFDDLEYIGDVTGTSEQSYLLNAIPYGGRKYRQGVLLSQSGLGIQLPNDRGTANAIYDALQQKPDADFVMPVSYETVNHRQFLGRREVLTVRFKMYKIKSK
ncbi:MAG: hypothetical protein RLZZ77_703 [Bacteroidota bacterium]|jgi:hypothetical protein